MTDGPRRTDHWRSAFPRLSRFAREHLLLLPLGAAIALVWVNTRPESYYWFTYAVAFVVNDVAMMFFFALMAKEVIEATAPGGVLHPWRRGWLPVVAAVGATVVPALIYVRAAEWLEEPMLSIGWPVSFATDIAVGYFVARVIFGAHPAVPFLLLLGIACDVFAFLALGLFNPVQELHVLPGALTLGAAIVLAYGLRRAKVKSFWPYLASAGTVSWLAHYWSGFAPALALVPIMPFLPHAARDPGFFVDAPPTAPDALSRFEIWWRHPVQATLFFFGLVNAGVPFHALEPGTWALPIAVITGRPLGTLLAVGVAIAAGLRLPHGVGWRELIVVALAAAVGFTIGLFICTALLAPGQLRAETSMGVLLTLAGAPCAFLAAKLLGVGRFAR
jgi:NhaA family Na+:H+ antiporter